MRHYIPEPILEDHARRAKFLIDRRVTHAENVTVHANVLLALIETYREARTAHDLPKSTSE